jgi:rod shape determining protein RodA
VASIDRRVFQHFDWLLFGLVWAVVAVGLANLFSATHASAEAGLPGEFRRQLVAVAIGAVAMGVLLLIDYRRLERWAPFLYVGALLLTARRSCSHRSRGAIAPGWCMGRCPCNRPSSRRSDWC